MTKSRWILYAGDILALVIIILIGFATHRETGLSFLPRMGALFFPLMISWLLVAPWLELFQEEIIFNPKQLWRPAFAILFAAPLATVLRGLILNAPIIPIFVIVLGGTLTLGMTLWRGIYFLMNRREQS